MAHQSLYAILQYSGRYFAGWQRQPNERTVQGVVEDGLERIVGHRVVTHAAGRTDAGVHARGQVVSFQIPVKWRSDELQRALDAVTDADLWIAQVGVAPQGFHARKHASARRYRFLLGCDPASASPFRSPYEWALRAEVDFAALASSAKLIVGTHDFSAFAAAGQEKPHYRCNVAVSEWRERPADEGFIFTIEADRFLHRMVRFLVGSMVDIARGRRPLTDMEMLLASTDNRRTSSPAPAQGLHMVGPRYHQPELQQINEFVNRQ